MSLRSATGTLRVATGALGGLATGPRSAFSAPVSATTQTTGIAYPTDAGVINVKTAFGVVGDGVTDDTVNIQRAFDAHAWVETETSHSQVERLAPRILFFPPGTYKISDTVIPIGSSIVIQGAGESRTTIKLADGATGFGAGTNKVMLGMNSAFSPPQGNAAFANYVRDLTIDVGANNPGAVGLRFWAANLGAVRRVTIKSSDATKRGSRGITLESTSGPALVQDLTVDGFTYGVWADTVQINNWTLSGLTLKNQTGAAIRNTSKNLIIENLTTENVALAVENVNPQAATVLTNATLDGNGSGPACSVPSTGLMWLRNVTVTGFSNIVTHGTTARFVGASSLDEWGSISHKTGTGAKTAYAESTGYKSLNLPMSVAPSYTPPPAAEWVNVLDYGATRNTGIDCTAAVQSALNAANARVVYFPYGSYTINGTLFVRNAVAQINFCFSELSGSSGDLVVEDSAGGPGTVFLEDCSRAPDVTINTTRTVVIRNFSNGPKFYTQAGAIGGTLYVENCGSHMQFRPSHAITAYVRQSNREMQGSAISGGATVRMFSDNVEQKTSGKAGQFLVSGGSTVEFIGGSFDNLGAPLSTWPDGGTAAFEAADSTISYVFAAAMRSGGYVGEWVIDRDGATVVGRVRNADLSTVDSGSNDIRVMTPLFVSS